MDVIEAIHKRQSVGKIQSTPVPHEILVKLLDAAVQAPNHYKVRPWRFVVLTGDGLVQLGDVMAKVFRRKFPDVDPAAVERERAKPLRAPAIIAVGVDLPADPRVLEIESICAAAAACQNLLLAAEAFGLGGHWRTGESAQAPDIKRFLGFSAEQHVIAFIYLGYPEAWPPPHERAGSEERTRWIG
jgi:nitroreductase